MSVFSNRLVPVSTVQSPDGTTIRVPGSDCLVNHAAASISRQVWRVALIALLLMAAFPPGEVAAAPGPGDADPALYAPVIASEREAVIAETEGNLSRFAIDATFTPVTEFAFASISGSISLRFVNLTSDDVESLPFRLYANIAEYETGAMSIDRVSTGDAELEVTRSVDDTVAMVDLERRVAPGESIDVDYDFTTTIPNDPVGSYGMFSFDAASQSYALAHWFPLLAGYDPNDGWLLDPPSDFGDPVFSNTALFDVQLTAPSELTFITTGSQQGDPDVRGELATHHFVSGPVRDFVMAAGTDFIVESVRVGETTVNSFYTPGREEAGRRVLEAGAQSLEFFSSNFGVYPYEELDFAQIDLGNGAGGVEFPQLMFIGADYYLASTIPTTVPRFLEYIVVHEAGHQWWYGLVGNNQYQHAFIDEGLDNYLTVLYFGEEYGEAAEEEQINYNLKFSYLVMLTSRGDQVVDTPTDEFPSQRDYGTIIYGKASLGFGAIHEELGDEAFFAGLQAYVAAFRFGVASPGDLKTAFEKASHKDLDELWRHWFEAAEGSQDFDAADLEAVRAEIGQ
jgi:Peptidase family M1 domain